MNREETTLRLIYAAQPYNFITTMEAIMLFRKNIEPNCAYCKHASSAEPGTIICVKHGIQPDNHHCRRFKYDPLRRVPPKHKAMDFTQYDNVDYTL